MSSITLPADDPRSILADRPMRLPQVVAIFICFLLNALDGFDVLAVTFAAPGIAKDWGVGPSAIGIIVSTGLVGMVIGSLTLGQLADRIGRRRQILLCLVIMTFGMLASAFATGVVMLSILRILTGLGLGAMLAAINAMSAEFANRRRRDLAVSIMAAGYPVGGIIGGWGAAQLLRTDGWEAIFLFGAGATALMIPLVLIFLPESIGWLATRGAPDALAKINVILRRLGQPQAAQLVALNLPKASMRALFLDRYRVITIALIIVYGLHMMTFYYALGWAPSLVVDLGFDPSRASIVSVFMNMGGAIGGLTLGFLSPWLGLRRLLLLAMAGAGIAVAVFGVVPGDFLWLQIAAFVLGFLANGSVVGLYALIANVFPTTLRATGTGAVIGFGRFGAALGPFLAGQLLAAGAGRGLTSLLLGLGSLGAAAVLLAVQMRNADENG
ncbi:MULTISPECIES: MFS transporter [Sphingobium]|uniref:Benzoate transport n=1 Tax=Sphingobium xenophagum TaxID=121428 RepID=A0ABU1X506_SPHXE|nr:MULTISPECIES: MFS transporter [Sphingobium]EXS71519.1 MFS transporter [Sphingobium sp. Ant17]MDR7156211.1 benzoate transport [Sphingobium xenophagum]